VSLSSAPRDERFPIREVKINHHLIGFETLQDFAHMAIRQLTSLRRLELVTYPHINQVNAIFSLTTLRELTLIGFEASDIPSGLSSLQNLELFAQRSAYPLHQAALTSEIAMLTNLQHLSLRDTSLRGDGMRHMLRNLSNLRTLVLETTDWFTFVFNDVTNTNPIRGHDYDIAEALPLLERLQLRLR
jgi:hypothetical protein